MTATPSDPASAGDQHSSSAEQNPAALTSEDQLQLFWQRNRGLILAGCIVVVLVIVGLGVWERLGKQKEKEIEQAYAVATTPEALKLFAETHAGHSLAGVAYLRLADEAFTAGKASDAVTNYEKAIAALKEGPLVARAKLGLAVANVVGGKGSDGAASLKQLAEDANQYKGIRAEAAYHLASIAAETGVPADVIKYTDLLMQIDPTSPWTQRGFALRATLPPSAVAPEPAKAAAPTAPAIQFGSKK